MPAMELPKTLVKLLDTLLTENGLTSWQIFEEKSSNIIVKIRFGNGHPGPTADKQPSETIASYRRKSPSQIKRDQARVADHKHQQSTVPRMTTRSMATCLPTEPGVTDRESHASKIEQIRYDRISNNDYNCVDPLEISRTPLCQPSCNAHDNSLMSKRGRLQFDMC